MGSLQNSIQDLQSQGFSTAYIVKSLRAGINDCQRFIDREGPRNPKLRPEKAQQHLDYCIAHKQRLQAEIDRLQADSKVAA